MERVLWPDVKELSPAARAILKPDHGTYQAFVLPTQYLTELAPHLSGTEYTVIIIYHDFLSPPRMLTMSSQVTHTHTIIRHTPLSPYT